PKTPTIALVPLSAPSAIVGVFGAEPKCALGCAPAPAIRVPCALTTYTAANCGCVCTIACSRLCRCSATVSGSIFDVGPGVPEGRAALGEGVPACAGVGLAFAVGLAVPVGLAEPVGFAVALRLGEGVACAKPTTLANVELAAEPFISMFTGVAASAAIGASASNEASRRAAVASATALVRAFSSVFT